MCELCVGPSVWAQGGEQMGGDLPLVEDGSFQVT